MGDIITLLGSGLLQAFELFRRVDQRNRVVSKVQPVVTFHEP